MKILKADFDNWHIEYTPDDGARITVLKYEGHDLLTSSPLVFRSPDRFYGEYETRPVYGYDDCFPTVDACTYPDEHFECRDHGELCWQGWKIKTKGNSLICSVDDFRTKVQFRRILYFEGNKLTWRFEVERFLVGKAVFLHVMHALLPLGQIRYLELPGCNTIFNEIKTSDTGMKNSEEVGEHLLALPRGSFSMLLLRNIIEGKVRLGFSHGLFMDIEFDHQLFPTLGIWWNNRGYPEEEGLRRTECAFEPIPGTFSDLSKSFGDGVYLSSEPGKPMVWEITWTVSRLS
jgi:hypothetical protein